MFILLIIHLVINIDIPLFDTFRVLLAPMWLKELVISS